MEQEKTWFDEIEITCPKCGKVHNIPKYNFINGTKEPELKKQILKGDIHHFDCDGEDCGITIPCHYPMLYQDDEKRCLIWYMPGLSDKQIAELDVADVAELVDGDIEDIKRRYRLRVVTSLNMLVEKILIFDQGLDDRTIEVLKVMLVTQFQHKYRNEQVNTIFLELIKGELNYTVFFDKREKVRVPFSRNQYDLEYRRYEKKFNENTKTGFAYIQGQWGIDMYTKIMKKVLKKK